MAGQFGAESVVSFERNAWSIWSGIRIYYFYLDLPIMDRTNVYSVLFYPQYQKSYLDFLQCMHLYILELISKPIALYQFYVVIAQNEI